MELKINATLFFLERLSDTYNNQSIPNTMNSALKSSLEKNVFVSLILLVTISFCSCEKPEKLAIDYHTHIQSPEMSIEMQKLCGTFVRCRDGKIPSSGASDLLPSLDSSKVNRAVIMSTAYMAGMPELELSLDRQKNLVRHENEYVAKEAAKSEKLYSFFSLNPIHSYAKKEAEYWIKTGGHSGLKLHLANADIDLLNKEHVKKIQEVLKIVDNEEMTILIHLRTRNPEFGAKEINIVISELLVKSPKSKFIIAHAGSWGGFDETASISLNAFTNAISSGTIDISKIFFDVAAVVVPEDIRKYYPVPAEDLEKEANSFINQFRQLSINNWVFGSDWSPRENTLEPNKYIDVLIKAGLTNEEMNLILSNTLPFIK